MLKAFTLVAALGASPGWAHSDNECRAPVRHVQLLAPPDGVVFKTTGEWAYGKGCATKHHAVKNAKAAAWARCILSSGSHKLAHFYVNEYQKRQGTAAIRAEVYFSCAFGPLTSTGHPSYKRLKD